MNHKDGNPQKRCFPSGSSQPSHKWILTDNSRSQPLHGMGKCCKPESKNFCTKWAETCIKRKFEDSAHNWDVKPKQNNHHWCLPNRRRYFFHLEIHGVWNLTTESTETSFAAASTFVKFFTKQDVVHLLSCSLFSTQNKMLCIWKKCSLTKYNANAFQEFSNMWIFVLATYPFSNAYF